MKVAQIIAAGKDSGNIKTNAGTGITQRARFTADQDFCKSFIGNIEKCLADTNVQPIALNGTVQMAVVPTSVYLDGIGRNYTKDGKSGTIATNVLAARCEVIVTLPNGKAAKGNMLLGESAPTPKGENAAYKVSVGRVPNDVNRFWVAFSAVNPITDTAELVALAESIEAVETTPKAGTTTVAGA